MFRSVSRILTSIRLSIEKYDLIAASPSDRLAILVLRRETDRARYAYHSLDRAAKVKGAKELKTAFHHLREKLRPLNTSTSVSAPANMIPFNRSPLLIGYRLPFAGFEEANLSVGDVLKQLVELIEEISPEEADQADVERLAEVLPEQSLGAATFSIRNDKLELKVQDAAVPKRDASIINEAKRELERITRGLNRELANTNCDRRVVEAGEALETALASGTDIISLGIRGEVFSQTTERLSNELPSSVLAILTAHGSVLKMYLGQYPEWVHFVQNAARAEITGSSALAAQNASADLRRHLDGKYDLADPEVPRLLRLLEEASRSPGTAGQRATFALVRALENFVIAAYHLLVQYLRKTGEKTVDRLSSTTSKLISAGVVSAAVYVALSLTTVGVALPGSGWIVEATKIVAQLLPKS
jgi:hypothetical protein